MTTYAKIIDKHTIERSPSSKVTDAGLIVNYNAESNAEQLLADGYLPVVYAPNPANTWSFYVYAEQEGQIVQSYEPRPLEDYRVQVIANIRADAEVCSALIKSGFSSPEIETWDKQEAGARALQADPEAVTPEAEFVKSIAIAIGIPVAALVERILTNVATANAAAAQIIGTQNRLEMAARAATTHEALAAIAWPETTEAQ